MGLEIPIWGNVGTKLKFLVLIISSVGKLQFPASPLFQPATLLTEFE